VRDGLAAALTQVSLPTDVRDASFAREGGRGMTLRFEQVRSLMQLLAEANEMTRGDPARNVHLLGGVRRLIGAAVGGFVTDCD
jgi:hypothetical protein